MATVTVRYIVDDVDASIDFYCRCLGFSEQMHPAPTFAMLLRGDLRLVLSALRFSHQHSRSVFRPDASALVVAEAEM